MPILLTATLAGCLSDTAQDGPTKAEPPSPEEGSNTPLQMDADQEGQVEVESPVSEQMPAIPPDLAAVDLYSPNLFEARNALSILLIGEEQFTPGGFGSGTPEIYSFLLTQEEWAALNDGDPVIFLAGPGDTPRYFGTLDRSQLADGHLRLSEELYPYTQDILADLQTIREAVDSDPDAALLDTAIASLSASLDADLWQGVSHVTSSAVFQLELEAARSLTQLAADENSAIHRAILLPLTNRIQQTGRGLAAFAIAQAEAEGADAALIAEAKNLVLRGETEGLLQQDLSVSIEYYLAAWELLAVQLTVDAHLH